MAALLFVCTKEEQCSVIQFLWSVGVSGAQSVKDFRHNTGVFTNGLKNYKNDRTNVTHDKGAGRPCTAITEDNIERVRHMVLLEE